MHQQAFDALNAARIAAGAGAVSQSTELDIAAGRHAAYVESLGRTLLNDVERAALIAATLHGEVADIQPELFYAPTAKERAVKSGAITTVGFSTEVIGGARLDGTNLPDGQTCVSAFLNSVYHSAGILSQATQVAIAQFVDGLGSPGCVIDMVASELHGQVVPAGKVIAWPSAGQLVPGLFDIDTESPRPAVDLITTPTAGQPIVIGIRNADWINAAANGALNARVTKFELRDAGGALVPAVILADPAISGGGLTPDSKLPLGFVALVPTRPLPAGVYTVTFAAQISSTKVVVPATWSFTSR